MSNFIALYDVSASEVQASSTPVCLSQLRPGIQLRAGKVNRDHLSAVVTSEGNWPPIIVRRDDNAIVDGHYRYLAARQLGRAQIDCVYFEGGIESAFLEALRQNRDHGLPLSLKDREGAARQVLLFHQDWSDRRVGAECGLAPGTVGRLRARTEGTTDQDGQLNSRLGRDGRRRPIDPAASRNRIITALGEQPGGSLRDIARITGTSPATVRAVKTEQSKTCSADAVAVAKVAQSGPASPAWRRDAALLSTADGETFVKWFERTAIRDEWREFVMGIPVSRVYEVADEARRRATAWLEFASLAEERIRAPRRVHAWS